MPMQPLDPSLFGGGSLASPTTQQPAVDAAGTDVLAKGTHVWYLHRSGAWQAARVTAVDTTDPAGAFYQIEMLDDGTIRDTERPRLKKRQPEQQVPPSRDARETSLPSATHMQPAAAANNPSPAYVTGHGQHPSQPNFGPVGAAPVGTPPAGTPAMAWQQQSVPHYPAQVQPPTRPSVPQHHYPYPSQYHPANMQGAASHAWPGAADARTPTQHGVQPGYQPTPSQWNGHRPLQAGQPQAPPGGYVAGQPYTHTQQQWSPHHAHPGQAALPHPYGVGYSQHTHTPGTYSGFQHPSQVAQPNGTQQPHMAAYGTQSAPGYPPQMCSYSHQTHGTAPRR